MPDRPLDILVGSIEFLVFAMAGCAIVFAAVRLW